MSNLRSKPLGAAPLDRALLDSAATPMRLLFGGIFLGWSWISTIIILGHLLAPALTGAVLAQVGVAIGDNYLVAFTFAVLVSAAEFVSAGRWQRAYWTVLLLCDASFTAYQTNAWLTIIAAPNGGLSTPWQVGIWLVAIGGGIVAAVLGERLLFTRRH